MKTKGSRTARFTLCTIDGCAARHYETPGIRGACVPPTRDTMPRSGERWIPETRNGQTVGWIVLDERNGQIVQAIRYGAVR